MDAAIQTNMSAQRKLQNIYQSGHKQNLPNNLESY
jgi:hypothetical protein